MRARELEEMPGMVPVSLPAQQVPEEMEAQQPLLLGTKPSVDWEQENTRNSLVLPHLVEIGSSSHDDAHDAVTLAQHFHSCKTKALRDSAKPKYCRAQAFRGTYLFLKFSTRTSSSDLHRFQDVVISSQCRSLQVIEVSCSAWARQQSWQKHGRCLNPGRLQCLVELGKPWINGRYHD